MLPLPLWRLVTAHQLRHLGLEDSADALFGIDEKSRKELHDKRARAARRRAQRKGLLGKLINLLDH